MARVTPWARALELAMFTALAMAARPAAAEPYPAWEAPIAEASARFGIPAAWVRRVIHAESAGQTMRGGRPIRSRVGAMGLMQLMPGTWQAMRRAHRLGPNPDNPRDNILAGTAYLRAMYDQFGYPGMFAKYNAGPARYTDHLRRGRGLPRETIDYVAKVTGVSVRGAFRAPSAGAVLSPVEGPIVLRASGRSARSQSDDAPTPRPGVFFDLSTAGEP